MSKFKCFLYHTVSLINIGMCLRRRDGGEVFRIQSQEGQDLCTTTPTEDLIFKTSTEDQTVDLTNKVMTKDSRRVSTWFHSVWRTTRSSLWNAVPGGYKKKKKIYGSWGKWKEKNLMSLGENVWEWVSGHQWKGLGIDDRIGPRTGNSERISLTHCSDTRPHWVWWGNGALACIEMTLGGS